MDFNTNFEQEKTWHELYREEQERLNRENTARKSKQIGLILLIIGVVFVLGSTAWNVYHGEDFIHGPKDIRRAERAGQRCYAYMVFLSPALTENRNVPFRYVVDQYGYEAVVFIHEGDAKKYDYYQNDENMYYDKIHDVEEGRLEGYATPYDEEDKAVLREFLVSLTGCSPDEITDEVLEGYFGEYYLKTDVLCKEKVLVFYLLTILGILLGIAGGLLYAGKIKYVQETDV